MNLRLNTLRQIGGVNSIDNFIGSWQRAANFHEIAPTRPSFRFEDEGEPAEDLDFEETPTGSRSLIRAQLEESRRRGSDQAVQLEDDAPAPQDGGEPGSAAEPLLRRIPRVPESWTDSIFSVEPSLASVFGGSYGTMYGSQQIRPRKPSIRPANQIFDDDQLKQVPVPEPEQQPLLIKQVEEDGVVYNVVVGQSTLPQTVFNSVNVLVGVGLLSLPLGLRYSGWVIGIVFFTSAVVCTRYTAKLLAKCLDVDNSLVTFADLAYVSFGAKARIATSLLFTIELVAACVALVILFADSLDALIPGLDIITWKMICCVALIPLGFLPLRLLSFTSILGILCCLGSKYIRISLIKLILIPTLQLSSQSSLTA
jgi:vesicular inhibitory amino acid transporter